jgi:hypothetical protein
VLATCSAVQCLPIHKHYCQQSSIDLEKTWGPTKIWRAWIRDLIDESLGMLKVSLAQTDSDGQRLMCRSAISLSPLVRHSITLLVKDVVGIFGAGSGSAGREERGRSHHGEETHFCWANCLNASSTEIPRAWRRWDGTPSGGAQWVLKPARDESMAKAPWAWELPLASFPHHVMSPL